MLTHHVVDEGTRQRHRGVGVDRDKELPLLWGDLPEFDRPLSVIGPDRRLADPGIIDQDIDKPEAVARLGNDLVDRLVACEIGLNRQQIGGLLPLLHNLRELGETLCGSVNRSDLDRVAEQAQHQLPADSTSGACDKRYALLFAHRPLLSLQRFYNRLSASTETTVPLTNVIVVASPRITDARLQTCGSNSLHKTRAAHTPLIHHCTTLGRGDTAWRT